MITFLELTREETEVLSNILSMNIGELRREISRTDDRQFRDELKKELECLSAIENQLEGNRFSHVG